MRILFVNKFLYPRGGAETYMFQLAEAMQERGHEVAFYGMADSRNQVPDTYGVFAHNVNFHEKSIRTLTYPFTILYSTEARKGIRTVIREFKPDIAHLNNINFQLTPSVLDALHEEGVPVVMTVHDFQLICPNHLLYVPGTGAICEKCINKPDKACVQQKCIHGSKAKSILGYLEAKMYRRKPNYDYIDLLVCPSMFMKEMLDRNERFRDKTVFLRNFSKEYKEQEDTEKMDYILYFGRFFEEKGIRNLAGAMKQLPDIKLVAAGMGPLEYLLWDIPNVSCIGFRTGDVLEKLIREARFSVYPSLWYENCPLSIMESQKLGTPCLATGIGGMTELVGKSFVIPDTTKNALKDSIRGLYDNPDRLAAMKAEMEQTIRTYPDINDYANTMEKYYGRIQSNDRHTGI